MGSAPGADVALQRFAPLQSPSLVHHSALQVAHPAGSQGGHARSVEKAQQGSWKVVSAQRGKAGQRAGGKTGDWNYQEGGIATFSRPEGRGSNLLKAISWRDWIEVPSSGGKPEGTMKVVDN